MVEFGHCSSSPLFQGAKLALEDEQLGFDVRYFGDNSCFWPDPFIELYAAARETRRIRLATGVINTVTRHPSVVANQIASIQIASGGRAICGVGKGDSAMGVIGRGPQRHAEFVEKTTLLRDYLRGRSTRLGHWDSELAWIKDTAYAPVPLEIMCSGPKSLHAAAALADRITLSVGAAPERIRWALERIDEGLRDAGRSRADVKVGAFLPLCLDDSRSNAAERLRTAVALTAHMASLPGMDLDGQPERLRRVTRQLRDAYDYRNHNLQPDNPHGRSVDPEFASWYGIGGPPAYVVERMGQLVEAGLSYIFLGKTPLGEREALADKVMPVVRKLRPGW